MVRGGPWGDPLPKEASWQDLVILRRRRPLHSTFWKHCGHWDGCIFCEGHSPSAWRAHLPAVAPPWLRAPQRCLLRPREGPQHPPNARTAPSMVSTRELRPSLCESTHLPSLAIFVHTQRPGSLEAWSVQKGRGKCPACWRQQEGTQPVPTWARLSLLVEPSPRCPGSQLRCLLRALTSAPSLGWKKAGEGV